MQGREDLGQLQKFYGRVDVDAVNSLAIPGPRFSLEHSGVALGLPKPRLSRILKGMEVQFTPETEKKLKELSAQSGRGTNDLVEDATATYLEELLRARKMLNSRYDDLKSGRVEAIDGEEAFARLKAKTEAQRNRST